MQKKLVGTQLLYFWAYTVLFPIIGMHFKVEDKESIIVLVIGLLGTKISSL